MRKAEKKIFSLVFFAFVLIIAFTVYLEMQVKDKQQNFNKVTAQEPIPSGPKVWVIPAGLNAAALPEPEGRGATVLLLYCAQCHDLPSPSMHNGLEWRQVLQRMEKRIQSRRGGMLTRVLMPPQKDWKVLQDYLSRFGQKPLHEKQLLKLQKQADWNSEENRNFQSTCSICHAVPDPAQHTANEWPRIVLRMKNNILSARQTVPDTKTTEQIIAYLQRHSKPKPAKPAALP